MRREERERPLSEQQRACGSGGRVDGNEREDASAERSKNDGEVDEPG